MNNPEPANSVHPLFARILASHAALPGQPPANPWPFPPPEYPTAVWPEGLTHLPQQGGAL